MNGNVSLLLPKIRHPGKRARKLDAQMFGAKSATHWNVTTRIRGITWNRRQSPRTATHGSVCRTAAQDLMMKRRPSHRQDLGRASDHGTVSGAVAHGRGS